jgi:hypothetical protein
VSVNDSVGPVPPAFVAVRVTKKVPATVGVPLITPVAAFNVSPAGRPVAENEFGLLVAVIW